MTGSLTTWTEHLTTSMDVPTTSRISTSAASNAVSRMKYCDMHPPGYHDVPKSRKDCEVCGQEFTWVQVSGVRDPERWLPADFPVSRYESGKKVIQDLRDKSKWRIHYCKVKEEA